MAEKLEALFQSLSGPWGYTFLFLSSFVENVFPPMPGDTFVVLGAFLVGRGRLAFFPAYLATLLGSVSGFMTCYAVGRRWGRNWFQGRRGRIFSRDHLARVESWFARYGDWVLAFNRFLSGFRAVVSFFAGMARMDVRKVLLFAFISCVLWNGLLMGMGLWAGKNWAVLLHHYQRIVFAALVVLILGWWIKSIRRRKRGEK